MKFIYLEPDEEITSIVDRLEEVEEKDINLVVPSNAQLWQSLINVKLLKREANYLNKKLIIITSDELGEEMSRSVGFETKKERDFPVELIREEEKSFIIDKSSKKMPADENEKLDEDNSDMIEILSRDLGKSEEHPIKEEEADESAAVQQYPDSESEKEPSVDLVSARTSGRSQKRDRMVDILGSGLGFKKKNMALRSKSKSNFLQTFFKKNKESREIKTRIFKNSREKTIFPKIIFTLFAAVIIMAALVVFIILPSAQFVLYPKKDTVNLDLSVAGSKAITKLDLDSNKIPLQLVNLEKDIKREFDASGQESIEVKAKGIISIYNEYSSSPQTLVATTRFESPEGKVFRILNTIVVPGAKIENGKITAASIDAEVAADQPGDQYNIGPSDFSIPGFKGTPKYSSFYGRSKLPMTGGAKGIVRVVSVDDLEKAKNELNIELENMLKEAIANEAPADLKQIEGGLNIEIKQTSLSAQQGTPTERFTLEMSGKIEAMFYKETDLRELIDAKIVSKVDEGKKLVSQSQVIVWQKSDINWQKGGALFSISVSEDAVFDIDIGAIKRDLLGLSEIETRKYLAGRPEIQKAEIRFTPFWVKSVPRRENRVRITIDQIN